MTDIIAAVKVSRKLQDVAHNLDADLQEIAGERQTFSLFVWTEGRANYISNSKNRAEIKRVLLSIIEGWDDGAPDVPAHEVS